MSSTSERMGAVNDEILMRKCERERDEKSHFFHVHVNSLLVNDAVLDFYSTIFFTYNFRAEEFLTCNEWIRKVFYLFM